MKNRTKKAASELTITAAIGEIQDGWMIPLADELNSMKGSNTMNNEPTKPDDLDIITDALADGYDGDILDLI